MADNDIATQLALVIQSIQSLSNQVANNHSDVKALLDDHESRIRALVAAQADNERDIATIKERQGTLAVIQTTFTAVSAAVAAMIGRSQ